MATSGRFSDIVDFIEEHGGSLSGEQWDELRKLVLAYRDAYAANKLSNWEARNG
jgi:hypothetical protein